MSILENREPSLLGREPKIISKDAYIQMCVDYALRVEFVKENEKDILIREYLEPIYQEYTETITEVRSLIAEEFKSEDDQTLVMDLIVNRLNAILESTKRIGSTDTNNIIRSIEDFYRHACTTESHVEVAAGGLKDFIVKLLCSKS